MNESNNKISSDVPLSTTAGIPAHLLTIERLKKLCHQFDRIRGEYPESKFEGKGVFNYIMNELKLEDSLEYADMGQLYKLLRFNKT